MNLGYESAVEACDRMEAEHERLRLQLAENERLIAENNRRIAENFKAIAAQRDALAQLRK